MGNEMAPVHIIPARPVAAKRSRTNPGLFAFQSTSSSERDISYLQVPVEEWVEVGETIVWDGTNETHLRIAAALGPNHVAASLVTNDFNYKPCAHLEIRVREPNKPPAAVVALVSVGSRIRFTPGAESPFVVLPAVEAAESDALVSVLWDGENSTLEKFQWLFPATYLVKRSGLAGPSTVVVHEEYGGPPVAAILLGQTVTFDEHGRYTISGSVAL